MLLRSTASHTGEEASCAVPSRCRISVLDLPTCLPETRGNTNVEVGSTCRSVRYALFHSMPPRNFLKWLVSPAAGSGTSIRIAGMTIFRCKSARRLVNSFFCVKHPSSFLININIHIDSCIERITFDSKQQSTKNISLQHINIPELVSCKPLDYQIHYQNLIADFSHSSAALHHTPGIDNEVRSPSATCSGAGPRRS